jgi:hypothetical protein
MVSESDSSGWRAEGEKCLVMMMVLYSCGCS